MFSRWRSTVRGLIVSTWAICSFVCASAISLTISSSRGVSGSRRRPPRARSSRSRDQARDRRGVEERLAAHRGAARLDQVAVGAGLEHVARRARLERLEEVLLGVVHREHQDAHAPAAAARAPRAACSPVRRGIATSRTARSTSSRSAGLDRLGAVAGLGDDGEVGLGVEHHAQAAAHHRVVVGEQDPRRCGAHGTRQGDGRAAAGAGRRRCRACRRRAARARASRGCPAPGSTVRAARRRRRRAARAHASPSAPNASRIARRSACRSALVSASCADAVDHDLDLGRERAGDRDHAGRRAAPLRSASRHSWRSAARQGRARRAPPGAGCARSPAPPPGDPRAASRASPIRASASAGTPRRARSSCSTTAVSDCPTSSCSSRAMRRRSSSCAASARRAESRRSSSSRSSMSSNARASCSHLVSRASAGRDAAAGLERVDLAHHRASRCSGANARRNSA